MIIDYKLCGEKILLRTLEENDCNEKYLRWMNDVEVNKYMETRWSKQTKESILDFVKFVRASKDCISFAIVEKNTGCHIGNIKLGPINFHNHHADISYFLGEKDKYGCGYITEAISLVCKFAVEHTNLHRVQAGFIEGNIGSQKVLEKNGFIREGVFIEKSLMGGGLL